MGLAEKIYFIMGELEAYSFIYETNLRMASQGTKQLNEMLHNDLKEIIKIKKQELKLAENDYKSFEEKVKLANS